MKKSLGFTLAEVLITLAIIGVVATMTLPTLMTNTGEQQAKTALKKGVNILTEAVQMHEAMEGFNFATIKGTNDISDITKLLGGEDGSDPVNGADSFIGLLRERTKIDYSKTANNQDQIKVGADESPLDKANIIY